MAMTAKEKAYDALSKEIQALSEKSSKAKTDEAREKIETTITKKREEMSAIANEIQEATDKARLAAIAKAEKETAKKLESLKEEYDDLVSEVTEMAGRAFEILNEVRQLGAKFQGARKLKNMAFRLEGIAKVFGFRRPAMKDRVDAVNEEVMVATAPGSTEDAKPTPPETAPFQLRAPKKDTAVAPTKESKVKHNASVFQDTRKGVSDQKK